MKLNKIIFILLILTTSLIFIGSISAQDTSNLDLNSIEIDDISDNDFLFDNNQDEISDDSSNADDNQGNSTEPKTWYVTPNPDNPNQVQAPTVQPAINNASNGDTIVLNGSFVHCHFTVNKSLTIIALPGTSVGVCPHHNHPSNSDTYGIFYITPEGNGSVLEGFTFTNDFYHMAYNIFNPFAVFIDGASNVELKNLVFNWTGTASGNIYNPKDFKFNPVILKNTDNITLTNLFFNNTNSLITFINSTNTTINNSTVINCDINEVSIENEKVILASKITASNLNIKVGDVSNLQIALKDEDEDNIINKTVTVIINGISRNVTTDNQGIATLPVKYASSGTYYATILFLGDNDYTSSVGNSKIVVSKKSTTLTAPKKTFKVKSTKKISITLKSGNALVKGKKITLTVNGKTYHANTNAKGIAAIKVKITKKGTYKYTAKFAGDSMYNLISKTNKIVVKK